MDDATRDLESAAFHAWMTFGYMLTTKAKVSKAEMRNAYDVLTSALEAFRSEAPGRDCPVCQGADPRCLVRITAERRAHGAPYAALTAAVEGTDPSSGP